MHHLTFASFHRCVATGIHHYVSNYSRRGSQCTYGGPHPSFLQREWALRMHHLLPLSALNLKTILSILLTLLTPFDQGGRVFALEEVPSRLSMVFCVQIAWDNLSGQQGTWVPQTRLGTCF